MGWMTILILVVLVAFAIIAGAGKAARGKASATFPYEMHKTLFTPAERSFLGVLDQVLGPEYRVFGKIRVADVLKVRGGAARKNWQAASNRISAKHFDLFICAASDLSVRAAIELDDRSHKQSKRKARDEFLEGACEAAGLPLIRIPAKRSYAAVEIREALSRVIGSAAGRPAAPAEQSPDPEKAVAENPRAEPTADLPERPTPAPPACPQCSAAMTLHTAEMGAMAGKQFWRCAAYPDCRGAVPLASHAESAVA